jgi:DNA-binding MarR family transcriptional regulator
MIEERVKTDDINELIVLYGVISFALTMRIAERLLKEYKMSLGEYSVLLQLGAAKKEMNLSQVKQNTYLFSGASITKVAEKLLNKAYVTRRENPASRREKLVKITATGEKALAKVQRTFKSRYPSLLNGFSPNAKDRLLKDLKAYFTNVMEMREHA